MSRASTHISVVIPTFNEQDNIVPLIRRTLHACTTHGLQPEVIVVDDNSRDLTAQQVINAFGQNAAIKLFVRKNERGLGTAIYFGVTRAKNPIIVSMDGDGNHLPEDIPNLIHKLQDSNDLVIASRFASFQRDFAGVTPLRYLATYFFNQILNASMQNMMKMMVVSLIVFGPALFLLKSWYAHSLVELPFALPVLHSNWEFEITNHVSWFWAYIYSSVASSMVLGVILKALKIEQ
jgi:glycosyltransferase involved in cell wall biosynthesis